MSPTGPAEDADTMPERPGAERLVTSTRIAPSARRPAPGRGLRPLSGVAEGDERGRMKATASLGQRLLARGQLAEARAQFRRELGAADRDRDPAAYAAAALGLGGIWVHEHREALERAEVAAFQAEALQRVPVDSVLALRLRTRLAAERAYVGGSPAELRACLERARRCDPVAAFEAASLLHHCILGPAYGPTRLALAEEMLGLAARTRRYDHGLMALMWRTVDLFLAGDGRARRALRELRGRLQRHRCDALAFVVAALDVTLAIRAGMLTEAERLAEQCWQVGTAAGDADAASWYGAQLVTIRWLQGRAGEMIDPLRELGESAAVSEVNPLCVAALAALAAAAGDRLNAQAALAQLQRVGLGTMANSSAWLPTVLGAVEAAHLLDDRAVAVEAYELLLPHAHLPVMVSLAVACFGSTQRVLGLAAQTAGRLDVAIDHFEAARPADLALGHRPAHALDLAALASALHQRGRPGDRQRAASLWTEAAREAAACEMGERARAWTRAALDDRAAPPVARPASAPPPSAASLPATTSLPAPTSPPASASLPNAHAGGTASTTPREPVDASTPLIEAATFNCRRLGRRWEVTGGSRRAVVEHGVGLVYLARLIDEPGVAISAIELASSSATPRLGANGQPVLDEVALQSCRRRVAALREELERADRRGDAQRSAVVHAQLQALVGELHRATRPGGRSRSFADAPERARTAVQKALRRAVRAIGLVEPQLGAAIADRLVTGAHCTFHPAPTSGASAAMERA